jgi:ABC-type multidrug transport system fused ATPase/permease subunit
MDAGPSSFAYDSSLERPGLLKKFIHFLIFSDKSSFVSIPLLSLTLGLFESFGFFLLIPLLSEGGLATLKSAKINPLSWISPYFQFEKLESILFLYTGLLIVIALGRYLQNNLAQRMRVRTESIFRNSLFQNLLDAKYEYLTNQSQAGISQVLVQEVNRISYSALLLVQILTSMILILTYMIVASFMSLQAVFIFVAFSALANLCIIKFRKNPVKMGEKIRQELSQFHQVLNQYMTGLKSIKIAGLEKFYTRQFQNISLRLEKIELEFTREQSKVKLIYEISIALSFSIGFFLLFSVLKMPVTALILCLLISLRLIPQIVEIQQKASQIRYFLPSY